MDCMQSQIPAPLLAKAATPLMVGSGAGRSNLRRQPLHSTLCNDPCHQVPGPSAKRAVRRR
jgi:hypothetical protein